MKTPTHTHTTHTRTHTSDLAVGVAIRTQSVHFFSDLHTIISSAFNTQCNHSLRAFEKQCLLRFVHNCHKLDTPLYELLVRPMICTLTAHCWVRGHLTRSVFWGRPTNAPDQCWVQGRPPNVPDQCWVQGRPTNVPDQCWVFKVARPMSQTNAEFKVARPVLCSIARPKPQTSAGPFCVWGRPTNAPDQCPRPMLSSRSSRPMLNWTRSGFWGRRATIIAGPSSRSPG